MLNNVRNVSVPIANGRSVLHRTVNGGICRLVSTACFASLNDDQRRELVALRSNNNGATLAAMLEATSLAVQPDLRANLSARTFAFYYLCGERDSKFRAPAAELAADCHVIPRAGHNAHRENPAGVIASLAQILRF